MSILSLAQWSTGSERVKVSVKNQNNIRILLKWIEKWLTYKIQTFWIVSNFFWFCLTFSVSEKLKNSVFEIPVIPENLNTSKLRTTNTKSIKLHTIEKLITYSLKNFCVKGMFAFTVFEILQFECRLGWYYSFISIFIAVFVTAAGQSWLQRCEKGKNICNICRFLLQLTKQISTYL